MFRLLSSLIILFAVINLSAQADAYGEQAEAVEKMLNLGTYRPDYPGFAGR